MSPDYLELRKERSFSEMLNLLFAFTRQNLGVLLKSTLLITSAPMLAFGVVIVIFVSGIGTTTYTEDEFRLRIVLILLLIFGIVFIITGLMIGISHAVVLLYHRNAEEPFGVREVWEQIKEDFNRIFSTLFFASIAGIVIFCISIAISYLLGGSVTASRILLIGMLIGFVYVYVQYAPIFMVRIQEELFLGEAMSRCRELMKGHWWSTFAMILVLLIYSAVVGYLIQWIGTGLVNTVRYSDSTRLVQIAVLIGVYVVNFIVQIPLYVYAPLQYYNLAARNDKDSFVSKIEQIGLEEAGE